LWNRIPNPTGQLEFIFYALANRAPIDRFFRLSITLVKKKAKPIGTYQPQVMAHTAQNCEYRIASLDLELTAIEQTFIFHMPNHCFDNAASA